MTFLREVMLASLLLVAMLATPPSFSSVGAMTDTVRHFPQVEGSNLEGRKFTLPGDLEAEFNVVIVAFRREQQADVDSWLPFLREQKLTERGIHLYELPTLSRGYWLMRRFIDGGMARGIPEKATREATITLYINKTPFKEALGITSEDKIVSLIVARDGRVLWRVDGAFAPATSAALAAALNALPLQTR